MDVPGTVKPTAMDFWDGNESLFVLPELNMKPKDEKAIWSSVTRMVKKQLLEGKGIRIPTLGCIEVVPMEVQVGSRTLVLPMPKFHMARNLMLAQNLGDKDDSKAPKPAEILKYAEVARAAKLSRQKVELLILRTTSLMYHCLEKAANVAFMLQDMGVIFIEGSKSFLRIYPQFLEEMTGWKFQRTTRRRLQGLGLVIPPELPIAALSPTRRLILFPSFEQACLPKPLATEHHKYFLPDTGVMARTRLNLAPPGIKWEEMYPIVPVPPRPFPFAWPGLQTEMMGDEEMEDGQLLPFPGAAAGEEQPGSDQAKDKSVPKDKVMKQSDKEAAAAQRDEGGRGENKDSLGREGEKKAQSRKGENKDSLGREGEKKAQSRKEIPSLEGTLGREGEKKTRQGKGGERRESLGKGGERRASLGKGGERRASLGKERERRAFLGKGGERRASLGKERERKGSLGREGERRDSLGREGKKKVGRGKEKEAKDAAGSKGEKKVSPKRGEKGVSPRRNGPKGVSPRRNGPKEVSPRRKGEQEVSPRKKEGKKAPLARLGAKSLLEREEMKYIMEKVREKQRLQGRGGGRKAAAGSSVLPYNALPRKPLDAKVFLLQPPEEAAQALRARPEAFWSVLKDPQKSILAGYRFASCGMLPPVPHQGSRAPKKRDTVSQGPWPWVQ